MSIHKASIDVVAAVINKNDLFLIANRSFEDNSQGVWEFPGGKVEENETFTSALVRDCLLYTSPSPRDKRQSRMPSSA